MMNTVMVNFTKVREEAKKPTAGSRYAAGYDLYACIEWSTVIAPHETKLIGTGIAVEIPEGYWGGIFARSGLATKQGLRPANCTGVIDSDYRGEVMVALHNDSEEERVVSPSDRIGQFVLMPQFEVIFNEVATLDDTERGAAGFGSTGK